VEHPVVRKRGASALVDSLQRQYRSAGPGEPPYVRGWPWLGVAIDYGKDAGGFLAGLKEQHGATFSVFLAGNRVTFVTDPRDYGAVLSCKALDFHRLAGEISSMGFGHGTASLGPLEDDGIIRLSVDKMRGAALGRMTRAFQGALETVLLDQPLPEADGFYAFVSEVMFHAAGRSVFGEGFSDRVSKADFEAVDARFPLLVGGVPAGLLGVRPARAALSTALSVGYDGAAEIIADRLRLMEKHDVGEEAGAMQLAFLWALQANTIPATFWSLLLPLRDPAARAALTAEVRAVLGDAPADPETGRPQLDRDALSKLVMLDSAISEALRMTSGSLTIREALEDVSLTLSDGSTLPIRQGDRVGIYPYLMHHDPALYPNPEAYQFDRYVDEDGKRKHTFLLNGERLRTYLMPFGGGVSMCPGRHFARNEIKIAAALLLYHFDAEVDDQPLPALDNSRAGLGILPPVGDVTVRLRRR